MCITNSLFLGAVMKRIKKLAINCLRALLIIGNLSVCHATPDFATLENAMKKGKPALQTCLEGIKRDDPRADIANILNTTKNEDGRTLLHCVRNAKIATFLLGQGGNPRILDNGRQTALVSTLHSNLSDNQKKAIATALLKDNSDLLKIPSNRLGWPILFEVARNPSILTFLIDKGADVHQKDNFGNTVLHRAVIESASQTVLDLLIEKGIQG